MTSPLGTCDAWFRPLYVMLKPIGAHCNLACTYCYYLEKKHLYDEVPRHVMSEALLEDQVDLQLLDLMI